MHYLIDGHNLIGKLPDISLAEEHDEVKLVLKLKSWTAVNRKRRVTVIFDSGLPGGMVRGLSNNKVVVVFASVGQTADSLLIDRLKAVKNPSEHILVTSDRQITAVAKSRQMVSWPSEVFALHLAEEIGPRPAPPVQVPEKADIPVVSPSEVEEWLQLFGPEPDIKPVPPKLIRPAAPQPTKEPTVPVEPQRPLTTQSLQAAKSGQRTLSEDEVAVWMELFGPEPQRPSHSSATTPASPSNAQTINKPAPSTSKLLRTPKNADVQLTEEEVMEWAKLFRTGKSSR